MKKLIIVRHAKSSWEDDVSDFKRPLQPKGIHRAEKHAQLLLENVHILPQLWVSSYATRALSTAVIFAKHFGRLNDLRIQQDLYTFSANSLKRSISEFPQDIDSVILFGHNNACLDLINQMVEEDIEHFKTASAIAILFKQNNWHDIANGKIDFLISKGELH